jgi:hypothetical protein
MAVKALFRAEDLMPVHAATGKRYELIRGELYEVTVAIRHELISAEFIARLRNWNRGASGQCHGNAWLYPRARS